MQSQRDSVAGKMLLRYLLVAWLVGVPVIYAQDKSSTQTSPSTKYGPNGKMTVTVTKSEDGTSKSETKIYDSKGKLKEHTTAIRKGIDDTSETDFYDDQGRIKKKIRVEYDYCGRQISRTEEDYIDGVLSSGLILKWGSDQWTPEGIKEWNPSSQSYEERSVSEWLKEHPVDHFYLKHIPLPNVCTATVENSDFGLASAAFDTPHGKVTVHLPDDLAAGDTITGTVISSPSGSSEPERMRNQSELNRFVIEIGKRQVPVSERVFTFEVPHDEKLRLVAKDHNGHPESGRLEIPTVAAIPAVTEFHLPDVGQAGKPVQVKGPCDGDFRTTAVKIGGTAAALLAESPRKVVVQSPRNLLGPTEIEIIERGRNAREAFRNLAVNLSAPKTTLSKGEQTTLTVLVRGLQDIKRDVSLRLEDRTPDVVNMAGGNRQFIAIHPADVKAEGTYTTERTLTGVRVGPFSIAATVGTGDDFDFPGPVTETDKKKLIEAWHKAQAAQKTAADAKELAEKAAAETKKADQAATDAQEKAESATKHNRPDEYKAQANQDAEKSKSQAAEKLQDSITKQNDADAKAKLASDAQTDLDKAAQKIGPQQRSQIYLDEANKLSRESDSLQKEVDFSKKELEKQGKNPDPDLQKHIDKKQQEANDKKQQADALKKMAAEALKTGPQ